MEYKKAFAKINNLKINCFTNNDAFNHSLNLYNREDRFRDFKSSLTDLNLDPKRAKYYGLDEVLEKINSFEVVEFQHNPFLFRKYKQKKSIYNGNNIDKRYISLDLVKANFQAFSSLVENDENWNEFINSFDFSHKNLILDNKQFRQTVFGQSKFRKAIQQKEQMMIESILEKLTDLKCKILVVSDDEIILENPSFEDVAIIEEVVRTSSLGIRFEEFTLKALYDKKQRMYTYKDFSKVDFEIKGVESKFYQQVFKELKGIKQNTLDLYFDDTNDELCRFDDFIF